MKYIVFFLLVGTLFSCKKDKLNDTNDPENTELILNATAPPFSAIPNDSKFYSNVSYGDHARHKFDIFLPASGTPTGLVIFMHGGGFMGGDKSIAYSNARSEEHTSELQSRPHLVCRLLLEKKKKQQR